MRLRPLIQKELRRTFTLLGDVALDANFVKKKATGFNFATASVVTSEDGTVPAKVVVTKTTKGQKSVTKTIMVRSSEVGSLSLYAEVQMDGSTWSVGDTIVDDGYILMLTIVKEVDNG